jgi:hypothetical protein
MLMPVCAGSAKLVPNYTYKNTDTGTGAEMSIFVDSGDNVHQTFDSQLALTCPHCLTFSHITPVSTPKFDRLMRFKPKQAGMAYRCESCNAPIFLKFNVKAYTAERVELSRKFIELERPIESFDFTHIPESIEQLFREALTCYSHACFNAFASMCRRTAQQVFREMGETGKLRVFDQLTDVKDMAEIDNETFGLVKSVIFDPDSDPCPGIDATRASILLELMKDMFYQCYVRKGKLQQAMMANRVYAEEPPREDFQNIA